jgi:hypothetical protein
MRNGGWAGHWLGGRSACARHGRRVLPAWFNRHWISPLVEKAALGGGIAGEKPVEFQSTFRTPAAER